MAYTQTYTSSAFKAGATLVVGRDVGVNGWNVHNLDTTDSYLQVFSASSASDVTLGTTVPQFSFWIPASGGWDDWVGFSDGHDNKLIHFSKGLVIAVTTTQYGASAPSAGLSLNIAYL